MSIDPTSTVGFPVFATKQAMLKEIQAQCQPNTPNWKWLIYRINNTDVTGLADGATVFNTADVFESSV